MKYQITFPSAVVMIEQERRSQTERNLERVPTSAYRSRGDIVADVTDRIDREYWCDAGGQGAVDQIRALLNARGNNPDWQVCALREVIAQMREHRPTTLVAVEMPREEYDESNCITTRYRFQRR
jgi:hypothetical protein